MGTIDIGPDGEPTRFKPGFLETEAMMRAGHEDFARQMGPGYPNVGLDDSYEDGMGGSESSLDGLAMSFRDLTGREAYR